MEEGADIEEKNQAAAGDILGDIRFHGQDGQVLEQVSEHEVNEEIIQDQATEDGKCILAREQVGKQLFQAKTQQEAAAQEVKDQKAIKGPDGYAFASVAAAPESQPLMRQECEEHSREFCLNGIKIHTRWRDVENCYINPGIGATNPC